MPPSLELIRATAADAPAVKALLDAGVAWQEHKGFVTLASLYTPAAQKSFLLEQIAEQEVYLARLEGGVVGTVRLHKSDERFWGAEGLDGLAGYVHGLVLATDQHHKGLGRAILGLAEDKIRAWGRPLVRLDCRADNSVLCDYYHAAGYTERGVTMLDNGWRARRFQKPLTA